MTEVRQIADRSKQASRELARTSSDARNQALRAIADLLETNSPSLLLANEEDVSQAEELRNKGESSTATLDRLRLNADKIFEMARSLRAVADLPDPIGRVLDRTELDTGLILDRVSCPLGVLAVIFEARPDAVTQIGALTLKSGNAAMLKAGQEVERSARALVDTIREALRACNLPEDSVSLVVGREAVHELLAMVDLVDLVIPRGSNQLVQYVQASTRIPVLGHAEGICHVYVDVDADLDMAVTIIDDAKASYPAACNAAETVLLHESVAATFLPLLAKRMSEAGVRLRGCERTQALLQGESIEPVNNKEWHTEYGDLTLAIKVVRDLVDAIEHIHQYGSSHTETIVTRDPLAAERFLHEVDSAGVYHNASTRFADGYRYGFGAEVGVSTSKLHARGPVGLEGLTTYKYLLRGEGQVVRDYQGEGARTFRHSRMAVEQQESE